METIKLINDEGAQALQQFDAMISNFDKTTTIVNEISKYYDTYSKNIDSLLVEQKVLQNPVEAIGADKENPIAPGFPGSDSQNYLGYFKLLNSMLNVLNKNSVTIRKCIIGRLQELNNDFQTMVKAQSFLISEASKLREQSVHDLTEKSNSLTAQKMKAEKLFKAYENKASAKNHTEMCKECEEFRKRKIAFASSYKEAYERHRNYIFTVNSAMSKVKESEIARQVQLKSILFEFCPAFYDDCDRFKESVKSFETAEKDWNDEFVKFAESNGIVRSSAIQREFAGYKFSFEDSRVDFAAAPEKGITTETPLFFAKVREDYAGEVDLKSGDRVYVYDGLHGKQSCVKTAERKVGFVPSNILEIIEGVYGIVAYPNLGGEGEISVSAGDIVLVNSSSENETIFENLRGEKGTLPDFCVIKEKA